MTKMQPIDWVVAGVGAEVGAGVLTYLGNLSLATGISSGSSGGIFGYLPVALVGIGIIGIGYGLVKDFFLDNLEARQTVQVSTSTT